jgi:hypothetical protein
MLVLVVIVLMPFDYDTDVLWLELLGVLGSIRHTR